MHKDYIECIEKAFNRSTPLITKYYMYYYQEQMLGHFEVPFIPPITRTACNTVLRVEY